MVKEKNNKEEERQKRGYKKKKKEGKNGKGKNKELVHTWWSISIGSEQPDTNGDYLVVRKNKKNEKIYIFCFGAGR